MKFSEYCYGPLENVLSELTGDNPPSDPAILLAVLARCVGGVISLRKALADQHTASPKGGSDADAVAKVIDAARQIVKRASDEYAVGFVLKERAIAADDFDRLRAALDEMQAISAEAKACDTCGDVGVFATDGTGPWDCYACGKKATSNGAEMPTGLPPIAPPIGPGEVQP